MGALKELDNGLRGNTQAEQLSGEILDSRQLSKEQQSILSRPSESEEEPIIEMSRTEFLMRLEQSEDVWFEKLMDVRAELKDIRLTRYRLERAEDNDCLVKFFEEGNRIFFTANEKKPMGFQNE